MTIAVSGVCNGQPWPALGETADLPDEQALSAIESGVAEAADEDAEITQPPPGPPAFETGETADESGEVETADAPPAETGAGLTTKSLSPPAKTKASK